MEIDLAYTGSVIEAEAAALKAFENGYRCLWTSETKHDPFLTLALASRACPELEIGTGIAVALARNPYSLAQSAWDLAALTQGKFRLGLGSQVKAHIERRFSMPWSKPVAQMREFVEALRALFQAFQSGQRLNFRGEYYTHNLLTPNFHPGPLEHPEIPIGLAAVGPQMTELAAETADFVILHPFTTVDFLRQHTRPALKRGFQKSSRSVEKFETVGSLFAIVEEAQADELDDIVRQKIAFYGSTPAYFKVLESSGYFDLGPRLHKLSKTGEWEQMSRLIDDELLEKFRVRAPRELLFTRIRERFTGLYDRVVLTVPGR